MRETRLFCGGWQFAEVELSAAAGSTPPENAEWHSVDIPHDWLIYDTSRLFDSSAGWYRNTFSFAPQDGRRTFIRFDGVYMDSAVFLNGEQVGEWKYGYTPFSFDLTDRLKNGENTLLVRCRCEAPHSRWYSGAGIYRSVWLTTVDEKHIAENGVYISTEKTDGGFDVSVWTETSFDGEAVLRHTLLDCDNNAVAVSEGGAKQKFSVEAPRLWSVAEPNLYKLVTELVADGEVTDRVTNTVGFRWTRFDCSEGFFLNGEHMKLNGVCQHHDLGCLGAAVNKEALRRQLKILREMGCNAIRTSHNPAAPELIDLCDEMGFLVDSEIFDMWERPKNPFDYARFFGEWEARDVAAWVRRDRNHPCVIMWSIGNEIYDTHADAARGGEITAMLRDQVRSHDPLHNAPVTFASNYMQWDNTQQCAGLLELVGYNYGEHCYDEHHAKYPGWVIYGSETASLAQTRGVYHFPLEQSLLTDDDGQCSALGNCRTSWGAKSTEACVTTERDTPYSLGQFIWSGFDYIGEPTPYHTKNSYLGHIDTAGYPKDSYYILKAGWTDYKTAPMVHLYPYWDFNEGQIIDVRACTNAPRVELFLNGRSLGAQDIDQQHGASLGGCWKVPYEKGIIEAVAYDEGGAVIARDSRRSFGDAAQIALSCDKTVMRADGRDMIFVDITMLDADGNPVENADNRVTVTVSGAARLVGLDNGDSKDYDSYKGVSRRLFAGKLLAMVEAKTAPGDVTVTVSSKELPDASLVLTAEAAEVPDGVTALECCCGGEKPDDVPVRMLELVCSGSRSLNEKQPTAEVRCVLHPANASYSDVVWRAANDAGVESNLARIEADGLTAKITALGDGDFRVRCGVKNGDDTVAFYSQLEFTASGLGEATINPYKLVAGALFTRSGGELGTGIEHGFATVRDEDCWACFDNIDFGAVGSDEITIPIFCIDSDPLPIEIWEGTPEDGVLIDTVVYHKECIWNTYQAETYKLPRRIKGVTSVSLRLGRKTHVQGFYFTKLEKAFTQLSVLENDSVSGDSYTVGSDAITGIGNNVSIRFSDMDFGAEGASHVTICGRTPLDKNTVQIRFAGESGEELRLVEFPHSGEYTELTFDFDRVTGKRDVYFVFLPGCNFDFRDFRFEA